MKNIKKIFSWILIVLIFEDCKALLNSLGKNYKLIQGNAKGYKIEDIKAKENIEYPKHNYQHFQKVRELWENYYRCLQIYGNQERKPEIRRLLEGQYTEFPCTLCPRPFQNHDDIEWKYKPLSKDSEVYDLEHLDLAQEMTLAADKTLKIYNAVEDFAGLYVCCQKKNIVSVYVLEVSKNDTTEKVSTAYTNCDKYITQEGENFGIHYQWTEWTECSSCGTVGRSYKYGTCFMTYLGSVSDKTNNIAGTIKLKSRRSKDFFESINPFKKNIFLKNSTSDDSTKQKCGLETIEKFSTGIPCASRYLPKAALAYARNYNPVKVAVKYCLESCYDYQIFNVYDAHGKLIESADNSAGIYSLLQELPQIPQSIDRKSVTVEFGRDITIRCPGTLFSKIPVTWKIKNEVLFPEIVASESKGRFTIDLTNRIQIKKLRLKDSHLYSCWQRNTLIGAVNLNVEKKLKISFDHHLALLGIIALIGLLLMVGSNAITKELNTREK